MEDHFGHRHLSALALSARLVIERLGKTAMFGNQFGQCGVGRAHFRQHRFRVGRLRHLRRHGNGKNRNFIRMRMIDQCGTGDAADRNHHHCKRACKHAIRPPQRMDKIVRHSRVRLFPKISLVRLVFKVPAHSGSEGETSASEIPGRQTKSDRSMTQRHGYQENPGFSCIVRVRISPIRDAIPGPLVRQPVALQAREMVNTTHNRARPSDKNGSIPGRRHARHRCRV